MPDARLQRTRASLPAGYQFGSQRLRLETHDMAEAECYGEKNTFQVGDIMIIHGHGFAAHVKGKPCPVCDRRQQVDLRTTDPVADTVSTE